MDSALFAGVFELKKKQYRDTDSQRKSQARSKKFSLQELVKRPECQTFFYNYLRTHLCAENLDFVQAVDRFKRAQEREQGFAPIVALATAIYERFIAESAPAPINVSAARRELLEDSLTARDAKAFPIDLFDPEVVACMNEMVPHHATFRESQLYTDMVSHVDRLRENDLTAQQLAEANSNHVSQVERSLNSFLMRHLSSCLLCWLFALKYSFLLSSRCPLSFGCFLILAVCSGGLGRARLADAQPQNGTNFASPRHEARLCAFCVFSGSRESIRAFLHVHCLPLHERRI